MTKTGIVKAYMNQVGELEYTRTYALDQENRVDYLFKTSHVDTRVDDTQADLFQEACQK